MMIPILTDYYAPGYLPGPKRNGIPPYLPNVNLAMRRGMIDQIGGYDEDCSAGEDADLCMRASQAGWALYFEPAARAAHEARRTLRELARQWAWYGMGGSHFFFKQQKGRFEVYLNMELTPKMHRYRRALSVKRFPVPGMLFVSTFLLLHLIGLIALLALAAGMKTSAVFLLVSAFMGTAGLYWRSPLRRLSWKELMLYVGIACWINWTCIFASLQAGLKKRRIFVYPGI